MTYSVGGVEDLHWLRQGGAWLIFWNDEGEVGCCKEGWVIVDVLHLYGDSSCSCQRILDYIHCLNLQEDEEKE